MNPFEHGGNIHQAIRNSSGNSRILDFSANINPLGPPEWLRPLLSSRIEDLVHYPDPENQDFVAAVARHAGVATQQVVPCNGTTELLYTIMRVIQAERVLIPVPAYVDYARAAEIGGKKVSTITLHKEENFDLDLDHLSANILPGDLVLLATPNNPTGRNIDRSAIVELAMAHQDSLFLVDEAFLDFCGPDLSVAGALANILTLNSMTKFYGVPGLRVGYGIMAENFAAKVREHLPPWSVNSLAQSFGVKALLDTQYQQQSRENCTRLRNRLMDKLQAMTKLRVYSSSANYIFIELLEGNSESLYRHCREHGLLIRRCHNYQGLEDATKFFRVAVRPAEENRRLIGLLESYFTPGKPASVRRRAKRATSIMFQGTCSDAGKSILTAGLCRILFQDGLRVAPFKAQNMSLNSFVTLDGNEMGRAQVVQAQAARLDPDCRMNPILLKPNSDTGSQIIVSGKPVGNMSVMEYNRYKPKVWDAVCSSYDALAADFDVVVLEGAGSPGEVNLKHDDIVNMRMARYAESPVLLVGDIDRGGVYASFVGIMEVLAEWERQLIAGFVVNKFRGQASLLDSAHRYVELHTGKKVFGVIPHLANLGLPEEDSVSFKKGSFNKKSDQPGIDIALINLPHISNFTDVEPFLDEPDVCLRVIDSVAELGSPDTIILPGSKNVIHDLQLLQRNGFTEALRKHHNNGVEIVGICGGYMMLGNMISDPYRIESSLGSIDGLGMLNIESVIEKDKNLTRKQGMHSVSKTQVCGYEIHHGLSTIVETPLLSFEDGTSCGTDNGEGVWGSYLHGIFDSDEFRRWFIDGLRQKKGLKPLDRIVAPYDLEAAFDRLADSLRENLDMDEVYRLLGV